MQLTFLKLSHPSGCGINKQTFMKTKLFYVALLCTSVFLSCEKEIVEPEIPEKPPVEKPEEPDNPNPPTDIISTSGIIKSKIGDIDMIVGTDDWKHIAYGNGKFVAIDWNGYASTSIDGINWSTPKKVTTNRNSFQSLRFINGQFILVNYYDGQLCFTTDGMNWTTKNPISRSYFYDIAYGNGKYVIVGYQGYIAVLTNDFKVESYQWIKNDINHKWKRIVFGNGKFVVVDDNYDRTSSSTDGINWTPVKWGRGADVTYGNGKFVSVCNWIFIVSADGESWKSTTLHNNSKYNWASVTYKNGKFIAVGHEYVSYDNYIGYVTTSIDGENWTTPEQIKDESGKVVTAQLNGVCAMP